MTSQVILVQGRAVGKGTPPVRTWGVRLSGAPSILLDSELAHAARMRRQRAKIANFAYAYGIDQSKLLRAQELVADSVLPKFVAKSMSGPKVASSWLDEMFNLQLWTRLVNDAQSEDWTQYSPSCALEQPGADDIFKPLAGGRSQDDGQSK